jgi:hypothetical protein
LNERIWELWHQATLDPTNEDSNDLIRRFAELIVKECAEVAGCNGHVSGFALGDLIKEHFGVEE